MYAELRVLAEFLERGDGCPDNLRALYSRRTRGERCFRTIIELAQNRPTHSPVADSVPLEVPQTVQHLAKQRSSLVLDEATPVSQNAKQLASAVVRRDDVNPLLIPQSLEKKKTQMSSTKE